MDPRPFPTDGPYCIGETAFHHQGSESDLHSIIEAVAESGCHAVKFHLLLDLDDYMVKAHPAHATIKQWLFDADTWEKAIGFARNKGLDVVLLCNDRLAAHTALERGWNARGVEVHATGINDLLLLRAFAALPGTVILGVGGCTLNEIQVAVNALRSMGKKEIMLMHGFQNYPTDPNEIRLSRMERLRDLFRLPVGYADHTAPEDEDHAPLAACGAMMGVNVLEKHITPWPGQQRIDHQAAIGVDKMQEVIRLMKRMWTMRSGDPLTFSPAEERYGATGPMKKAIVASRVIPKGKVLSLEDLAYKRTGRTERVSQDRLPMLLGAQALRDIAPDEAIVLDALALADTPAGMEHFFINNKDR